MLEIRRVIFNSISTEKLYDLTLNNYNYKDILKII